MSSSDSDEDLNVSQYDVEDDLNAYGSPVYSAQVGADTQPLPAVASNARTQVSNYVLLLLYVLYIYKMKIALF